MPVQKLFFSNLLAGIDSSSFKRFSRYIFGIILLAIIYIAAAKFGLSLAFSVKQVTTVWPPTGIALAALFLFGNRYWPGIFIGAFVVNFLTAEPPLVAFGIAVGNTLEALTGSYLLKHFRVSSNLSHIRDVIGLVVLAAILSTAISATVGVLVLIFGGLAVSKNFLPVWQVWWVGDMLGNLVVAPLILSWSNWRQLPKLRTSWLVERLVFIIFVALICWFVFFIEYNFYSFSIGPYVVFPLLIWAGLRFSRRETSFIIIGISSIAIWATIHGSGPFGILEGNEAGLVSLQLFMAIVSISTMLLAAAVAENEELRKDLGKFKLAVDNESDHVMITDINGKILYANRAAENITGYTADEIVGKNASEVWGGNMSNDFYKKMWHTIKIEKKAFFGEVTNRRKNGKLYAAEIRIAPILDSKNQVQFFVGVERDVGKEKEADQAKADFISFASHQLRTPLTVINWNMEMLRSTDAGNLSSEQKKYMVEIDRGGKRMVRLINALLNISRLESENIKVEPKPTDIIELISNVVSEINVFARSKNCSVTFHKPVQMLPPVNLDSPLFRQVITNLLNNATRYSKTKKCNVEVDFKEIDGYYQVDVKDEGVGIPARVQNKIFDKFFRADNAVKIDTQGTGLGLYIAKKIVEISGGRIWFESVEGKGSVFHFTIPTSGMKKIAGEKELSM